MFGSAHRAAGSSSEIAWEKSMYRIPPIFRGHSSLLLLWPLKPWLYPDFTHRCGSCIFPSPPPPPPSLLLCCRFVDLWNLEGSNLGSTWGNEATHPWHTPPPDNRPELNCICSYFILWEPCCFSKAEQRQLREEMVCFSSQLTGHTLSRREVGSGTQGKHLEAGMEAEVMEECCLSLARHGLFSLPS